MVRLVGAWSRDDEDAMIVYDPGDGAYPYPIPIEDCFSEEAIRHWVDHLEGKCWATDAVRRDLGKAMRLVASLGSKEARA